MRGLNPEAERSGAAPEAPLSLLRRLLEENGCKVAAQAGDAGAPIRKVKAHKPNAAVVDLRMPPTNTDDGPRAALEIRAEFPEAGVLGLPPAPEDHRRVLAVLAFLRS